MTQQAFLNMAVRLTLVYAALFCGTLIVGAVITPGLVVSETGVIGGDFLAFYTAGDFALNGNALAAYDFAAFDASLKERAPLEALGMMWQYPPTMFFIAAPFALLPYKASYLLWCAMGWGALLWSLRALQFRGHAFWLMGFSVLCVNVVDNGQISLVTAALLFLSVYDPKRRWLVAGAAAGLLTIKPQLGLLLPLAFMAAGAWRTIAVAAATAMLFHMPSVLVFGFEGWGEFLEAAARLNADVVGPGLHTPPQGMTTLFGQLRALGAPAAPAVAAQYGLAVAIMIVVGLVWRRSEDALGKAALLCAGAVLASPYAYAYEMAVLILPAAYLARQAADYRAPEALWVMGGAILMMVAAALPPPPGLQIAFVISAAAFVMTLLTMLRPAHDHPPASAVRQAA
ncbi:glycosyltransferase family 87 protein [Hyphococcus sp.]|uniref:glycosyltransferase family 87 protein n=1 Tax=Hyphococcus sp. TaxID=2038636 RepID=UPI0035C6881E